MKSTVTILGIFLLLLIPGYAFAQFSGTGSGTSGDPYQVATAAQLNEVRNNLSAYYIQTADINLDVAPYNNGFPGWQPIGNNANQFNGHYNGNSYAISGLRIIGSVDYIGLFGYAGTKSVLQNVGLKRVDISGGNYTGGLVGYNAGTISQSYATGHVSSGSGYYTGGLVGENSSYATVTQSYATVFVSGGGFNGGLVGV